MKKGGSHVRGGRGCLFYEERKQVGAREDRRRNGSKGEGNEGNSLVTGGGVSPFLLENA